MQHQDVLFSGGVIETLTPDVGRTDALLVSAGTVIAHGDRARAQGRGARKVDLDGRFVMPGLIDAHNHHVLAGQIDLFELEVSPAASVDELLDRVEAYAATLPAGAWVVGGSWGSGLLDQLDSHELRARLDRAAGGRPVTLRDDAKHNRWASSEALRRAGIDASTSDPAGGVIRRSPDGAPTGMLLESAGIPVEHALARDEPPTAERLAAASERAISMLHGHGITAFQDAGASLQLIRSLRQLDDAERLHAWVVTSMLANDFIFGADPVGEPIFAERDITSSKHHRPTFIKVFLDGVPPSRTSAFIDAYLPDAHGHVTCGEPTMSQAELDALLGSVGDRGLGAKVHCTGDLAVRMVLDAAQRQRARGNRMRLHIAHGQFVQPEDRPRFAELDVTAEISPVLWHPGVIPDALEAVLGERGRRLHPNRALLDAGARLVGGSDWPVSVTPAVWPAVAALVTREDPADPTRGSLWGEQAIDLDEAIRAYTTSSATALGIDDVAGSLSIGRSADLIALSADPWSIDIGDVAGIATTATWFEGSLVHGEEAR